MKRNLQAGARRNAALRLEVFTEADLDDIHRATLEVLERTGVWVEGDEALDIFADGGCRVDRETRVVKIPAHIVEDTIRDTPATIRLCGRDPKNDVVLEAGRVGFTNFSAGIMVLDPRTGEYRESRTQDVADLARMTDYLSEIDTFEHAVEGRDAPEATLAVRDTALGLLNTTKCVGTGALSTYDVDAIVRMGAAVVGGEDQLRERPVVYFCECPVSPLKITKDAGEVIIGAARHGIPNNVISMAMAGASSPITLAGTLVTHNCEVLASLTLAQLTERGAPSIYGSSTTAIDLRFAAASVGSPELSLINAAVAQLAQRYKLPSFVAGA
jgi:trimethylamine--corrinoid protein Co-methyltransferase